MKHLIQVYDRQYAEREPLFRLSRTLAFVKSLRQVTVLVSFVDEKAVGDGVHGVYGTFSVTREWCRPREIMHDQIHISSQQKSTAQI